MKSYKEVKDTLLSDETVLKEYELCSHEFEIAKALIEARHKAHLTQVEVAERMKTSQAQIARMESGSHSPSLRSLYAYAKAIGRTIHFNIKPV